MKRVNIGSAWAMAVLVLLTVSPVAGAAGGDEGVQPIKERLRAATDAAAKTKELQALADLHSFAALALADEFLADPDVKGAAAAAVADIACGDSNGNPGLYGPQTAAILKKAAVAADDPQVRERIEKHLATIPAPPEGFVPLFNGHDLTGWKGLAGKGGNPLSRAAMTPEELKAAQAKADESMRAHWHVVDGVLVFDGKGESLCTAKDYGDFDLMVDWKILAHGDSGIYLRGAPQVQIWDTADHPEGSGGLYNNEKNPSKPLLCADNPIEEWNSFNIKMVGDRVTVDLNGKRVVDNTVMENYWDRSQPIFPTGQIELQNHGNTLYFTNVFLREIPREQEWQTLFNGKDLTGWTGDTNGYSAADGILVCNPGGNLYTEKEYGDFVLHFEFRLPPGGNNGLAVRTPIGGGAFDGMELQILDDGDPQYRDLHPYQYHGSIYGIVPAKRGYERPAGEWNVEEVTARGRQITVVLNGETTVDANLDEAVKDGPMDGREHKNLDLAKGHLGFLGHGDRVEFRNIRVRELK